MRKIAFVRHSSPLVDPRVDPCCWELSSAGRKEAARMAPLLRGVEAIASSDEAKAAQTADILARRLRLGEPTTHPGLREHRRDHTDWRSREDFEDAVATLIARPDELVFGSETADQIHARFAQAVEEIVAARVGDIAIVTQGTVHALYVGRAASVDSYALWKRLGLPALVTMSWPDLELLDVLESI